MEGLHGESREVISNAVLHSGNVCDAYMVVTPGSHEKQVAYQGHKVGAFTRALPPDGDYCCVVTMKQNMLTWPMMAPSRARH